MKPRPERGGAFFWLKEPHNTNQNRSNMRIVSLNPNNHGKELVVPYDGKITVGKDGVAEVSDKCGHHLVEGSPTWSYEGKTEEKLASIHQPATEPSGNEAELKAKVSSLQVELKEAQEENARLWAENQQLKENLNLLTKEAEGAPVANKVAAVAGQEEQDAEELPATESDKEAMAAKLKEMNKNAIRELCQEAQYPQEEWAELPVADLREYVLNKALKQ